MSTHWRCLQSHRLPDGGRAQVSSQSKVSLHVPGASRTGGATAGGGASGLEASAEPPSAGVRTATTGVGLLAETVGALVATEQDEKTSISNAVVTANRVMVVCLGVMGGESSVRSANGTSNRRAGERDVVRPDLNVPLRRPGIGWACSLLAAILGQAAAGRSPQSDQNRSHKSTRQQWRNHLAHNFWLRPAAEHSPPSSHSRVREHVRFGARLPVASGFGTRQHRAGSRGKWPGAGCPARGSVRPSACRLDHRGGEPIRAAARAR